MIEDTPLNVEEIVMRAGEVRYRLSKLDELYDDLDLHRKHAYWVHSDPIVEEKLDKLRCILQRLDEEIWECYGRLNER